MQVLLEKKKEEKVLVPTKWGMQSPQGNQTMTRKAQALMNNISREQNKGESYAGLLLCFEKFFSSYERTCLRNKNCSEAKEEFVQENVLKFSKEVASILDINPQTLKDLWERRNYGE